MKIGTVIAALLLAFLLFTPQGRFIGEAAFLKAVTPTPDPAKITACEKAPQASSQKDREVAKRYPIPGFNPNAANLYKLPPC